jgi:outer membrane protein OmpA-like peptidoglycan-associated protein
MAGASGGEAEENYWPGYVDALTTMTMVLTFIMMVLGVVIFSMSQNVSKAILIKVAAAARVNMPQSGGLEEMRETLVSALEKSSRQPAPAAEHHSTTPAEMPARPAPASRIDEKRIETAAAVPAPLPIAGPSISQSGSVVTLVFKTRSAQLDAVASGELQRLTQSQDLDRSAFDIRGYADVRARSVTQARRLAYYRAMLVRSELVKSGIAAARISVRIEDGNTDETDLVRIYARP